MERRLVFNPRTVAWVVVGAVCGLLAVQIFLAGTSPRTCGESVDGLCHPVYRPPLPWYVWPAGAFVGAVTAGAVAWSIRRFLPRK
jgi:hypothetical protein